ncbi:MAG TPA: hypothetical protein GX708_01035 [Gallicola sp.]|nr:hypothetical protein [Gallicola sp.]
MDLKEAYERIEWQIKHDVDNYDKDPTIAGIIDLERIKEAIDELQAYKDKEEELKNNLITLFNLICDDDTEFEFFKEIFCRKLEEMGIIKKIDGYYEVEKRNNIGDKNE